MPSMHPTSHAQISGSTRYGMPRIIVRSLPRAERPRCLGCDCQLWSGPRDGPQLCWTCRRSFARTLDASDDHVFCLVLARRLWWDYGEPVDLAAFFGTTDRARIRSAVRWWRKRGAVIEGTARGLYRIVGWDGDAQPQGKG